MRAPPTHDLVRHREHTFTQRGGKCLAIVDVESYPCFIAAKTDSLDLMAHLSHQMQALTAIMWETSEERLRLRTLFAEDDREADALVQNGHRLVFNGWVRTNGLLALTSQEQLLELARHRARHLSSRSSFGAKQGHPRLMAVRTGIYSVSGYSHRPAGKETDVAKEVHYTLVLRRYPHPAPRVAPRRITSPFLSSLEENGSPPEGAITSHSRVW